MEETLNKWDKTQLHEQEQSLSEQPLLAQGLHYT